MKFRGELRRVGTDLFEVASEERPEPENTHFNPRRSRVLLRVVDSDIEVAVDEATVKVSVAWHASLSSRGMFVVSTSMKDSVDLDGLRSLRANTVEVSIEPV